MNRLERHIERRVRENVPDLSAVTPGLVLDVHLKGRRVAHLELGRTYRYYDLASLTKIIFTASASMIHFAGREEELDQPIKRKLAWWTRSTTPRDLLTHTAGLEWWLPMYKKLKGPMRPEARWAQLERRLAKVKSKRSKQAVYSDIDLWMMGAYLVASRRKPLLEIWQDVRDRLELDRLFFHPGNRPVYSRASYAPTEDCTWRKQVLQGEVHDENTWALGGVAPHAGLFGDIESVSDWGLKLRAGALDLSRMLWPSAHMVREFTRRQIPRAQGDWGLGFMKPSRPKASCGKYFHASSFGHTGFTGTSLWFDPKRDLLVVILSNRVHPTRENKAFVSLRPRLHEWICEGL